MDASQKEELTLLIKEDKPKLKSTSVAQYVRSLNTIYQAYIDRTKLPIDDPGYIEDKNYENIWELIKLHKLIGGKKKIIILLLLVIFIHPSLPYSKQKKNEIKKSFNYMKIS